MKQKSIHLRIILFVVMASVINIGLFGIYEYYNLSRELELRFEETKSHILNRLRSNLVEALWNFDSPSIQSQIKTEITQNPEVSIVYVKNAQSKYVAGVVRDVEGNIMELPELKGTLDKTFGTPAEVSVDVSRRGSVKAMLGGVVTVYFTRTHIDEALTRAILKRLLEMFVITVLLVSLLLVTLRMVFRPLNSLRDALFKLAKLEGEEIQELPVPEEKEFGEVINGFNQTQRKLKLLVERRTQAEQDVLATLEQLKQTQEEFIKQAKLAGLGSLVAGISHELNTPIGNGLLAISSLQDSYRTFMEGTPTKKNFEAFVSQLEIGLDIAGRSLERSAVLVQNFKNIAVDQTSENMRTFDLHELIGEALFLLQPTLKKTSHKVEVSVLQDVQMTSYPGALVQVITNLVNNTIIHAFDGIADGIISISASSSPDAEYVRIEVADNGRGISEENLPKIFNPFFSTKFGQGGSGLGLHICHNIVSGLLSGTLDVRSTEGKGTVFVIIIPRAIASQPKVA